MADFNFQSDDLEDNIIPPPDIDGKGAKDAEGWGNGSLEEETHRGRKLKNDRYHSTTSMRNDLALIFTFIIAGWLFFVGMTLWNNSRFFKLSESVLITLLTTTTVNVLGMMFIILKDLFPGKNEK